MDGLYLRSSNHYDAMGDTRFLPVQIFVSVRYIGKVLHGISVGDPIEKKTEYIILLLKRFQYNDEHFLVCCVSILMFVSGKCYSVTRRAKHE